MKVLFLQLVPFHPIEQVRDQHCSKFISVIHFLHSDVSDFNTTVQTWVFPSGQSNPDVDTPIQITDDEKDEAIQVFIAFLEVIDAVNFDLLTVTRPVSICRIVDDDRK